MKYQNVSRMHTFITLWLGIILHLISNSICINPRFDASTEMRLVLVPADAAVGSVIYRLRATDEEFDYPLIFELVGDASSSSFHIETLPCTKYNSVCQANVVLKRRLEAGRYYDFHVSVRDTRGGTSVIACSITATNFTTPHDVIFPRKTGIIMVPENAKRGTELDYVIARKNPLFQKPVYLELWGSPLFAIRQKIVSPEMTEGTVFLLGPLDFEKQSMYHLTLLANDAYAEPGQDSRNIAGIEVVVIVEDVQDEPPVFTLAPPVTRLPTGLIPGDKVLQVHAEDGDKGVPREIRYGLVSEGNPFVSFFDINETTGEIRLVKPIDEISALTHTGDPVLLTVIAEEVKVAGKEPPAMSSTVQLALFLPERSNSPPYFDNDHYVARIDENSHTGTALVFPDPYVARVSDDDAGKNGVFSLTLLNNNGTFEISPNVAERRANFVIRVRDNQMLDYETHQTLSFQIVAQELGPATNLSATVNVTVYINDVNDNPPVFDQSEYHVQLAENVTAGTKVTQVHAEDVDTGNGGSIRYTQILGYQNTSLNLDPTSGAITISTNNHGFDREQMPEFHLYVVAIDDNGAGNRAEVPLIIHVLDVNDETPTFEKPLYEFILTSDMRDFTAPAYIKAIDNDAEPPNNVVRYEIINGNYENKFTLNEFTGRLTIKPPLARLEQEPVTTEKSVQRKRRQAGGSNEDIIVLTARAFDLGVPVRWSTCTIRIYPPESRHRTVTFVVPGRNPDRHKTEETLIAITGGRVIIQDMRPYNGQSLPPGSQDLGGNSKDKTLVVATVLYDGNAIIDISEIQKQFGRNGTLQGIIIRDDSAANAYKAENRVLFWLMVFFALLLALGILTLLLCCICPWCPMYSSSRKRIVSLGLGEDAKLVRREQEMGKSSKSVQVAEWMGGGRQAWSAAGRSADSRTKPTHWKFAGGGHSEKELGGYDNQVSLEDEAPPPRKQTVKLRDERRLVKHHSERQTKAHQQMARREVAFDDDDEDPEYHKIEQGIDDDSMRRAEMERGSDVEYGKKIAEKGTRELFIKEGNAEILRLITRGKNEDENIYVNLPGRAQPQEPQYVVAGEGGKEILMRRYIEEQANGKQVIREHYQIVPAAGSNVYQEALETQKNVVALEKEKQEIEKIAKERQEQEKKLKVEIEKSLQQQNKLLRQILLEKEKLEEQRKEFEQEKLETQSLPLPVATTQTDCVAETQTDPVKKSKSENDDSFSEEDEYVRYTPPETPDGVYMIKRKRHKRFKHPDRNHISEIESVKRKIRTPILEETEDSQQQKGTLSSQGSKSIKNRERLSSPHRGGTTSTVSETPVKSSDKKKQVMLKRQEPTKRDKPDRLEKKTLTEIANSMDNRKLVPKIAHEKYAKSGPRIYKKNIRYYGDSEGSEREVVVKKNYVDSDETDSDYERQPVPRQLRTGQRQIDVLDDRSRRPEPGSKPPKRPAPRPPFDSSPRPRSKFYTSEANLVKRMREEGIMDVPHGVSRYMDWYYKMNKDRDLTEQEEMVDPRAESRIETRSESKLETRSEKGPDGKSHSTSEHKYECRYDYKPELHETKSGDGRHDKCHEKDKSKLKGGRLRIRAAIRNGSVFNLKRISPARLSRSEESLDRYKQDPTPRRSPPKRRVMLKEDLELAKKVQSKIRKPENNHPLLQHSEHRFEQEYTATTGPPPATKLPHYLYPETPPQIGSTSGKMKYSTEPKISPIKENEVKHSKSQVPLEQLNVANLEDDHDSGIAMNSLLHSLGRNRNPIADKKSVFTIAYDGVHVDRIPANEQNSPPFKE